MANKIARKQSSDPDQEHLREEKSKWNKHVSSLISEIIVFKRAVNGKGDIEEGLPSSSIKHPLPQEVMSYLSRVTSDFQTLSSGAARIFDGQKQYSEHRQKGRLEQSLASNREYSLVKDASWWGSRLLSKVTLFSLHKDIKLARIKLLKELIFFRKDLKELESELLTGEQFKFILKLRNFAYGFINTFVVDFKKLKKIEEDLDPKGIKKKQILPLDQKDIKKKQEPGTDNKEDVLYEEEFEKEPKKELSNSLSNISAMLEALVNLDYRINFLDSLGGEEGGEKDKLLVLRQDLSALDTLLLRLHSYSEDELKTTYIDELNLATKSIKEIDDSLTFLEKRAHVTFNLIKEAKANLLKRWIARKYLGLRNGPIPQISLEIVNHLIKIDHEMNKFMDFLEKKDSSVELDSQYKVLIDLLKVILDRSLDLGNIFKSEIEVKNLEGKKNKNFKKEYLSELLRLRVILEKYS